MKNFEDTYIVKQGWMITVLNLKSYKLDIFALIYGFCQDGESEFHGSINYMAKWATCGRSSVKLGVKSLVKDGYIIKKTYNINGTNIPRYRVNFDRINKLRRDFRIKSAMEKEGVSPHDRGVSLDDRGVSPDDQGGVATRPGGCRHTTRGVSPDDHNNLIKNLSLKDKEENKDNSEASLFFLLMSKVFSFPAGKTISSFPKLPDNETVSGWIEKYGEAHVVSQLEAAERHYTENKAGKRQAASMRDFGRTFGIMLSVEFITPEIANFADVFCAAFLRNNNVPYRFSRSADSDDVAGAGAVLEYVDTIPGFTIEKLFSGMPDFWKTQRLPAIARNVETICAEILRPKAETSAVNPDKLPAFITPETIQFILDESRNKK